MIQQFVPSEYCLNRCRLCCRFSDPRSIWSPSLLNEEIEGFLKNNIPASVVSKGKKIILIPYPQGDMPDLPSHMGKIFICPFLNFEDNKCRIYPFRPFECQLYPFLINQRDEKIFLSVDLGCPYVKEKVQDVKFKAYVHSLADFLNSLEQLNKIKNNPQIIQVYPDALDLVELKI